MCEAIKQKRRGNDTRHLVLTIGKKFNSHMHKQKKNNGHTERDHCKMARKSSQNGQSTSYESTTARKHEHTTAGWLTRRVYEVLALSREDVGKNELRRIRAK